MCILSIQRVKKVLSIVILDISTPMVFNLRILEDSLLTTDRMIPSGNYSNKSYILVMEHHSYVKIWLFERSIVWLFWLVRMIDTYNSYFFFAHNDFCLNVFSIIHVQINFWMSVKTYFASFIRFTLKMYFLTTVKWKC